MTEYRIVVTLSKQETPERAVKISLEHVKEGYLYSTLTDAPIGLMVRALEEGVEGEL